MLDQGGKQGQYGPDSGMVPFLDLLAPWIIHPPKRWLVSVLLFSFSIPKANFSLQKMHLCVGHEMDSYRHLESHGSTKTNGMEVGYKSQRKRLAVSLEQNSGQKNR